ncbi:MAG: hypothetical protein M3552_03195 [Planctomycetota bacterium]|nr:hypothetical protein [Planctomycetaceae bacterium]MDQ3329652.1 hypothetical protein [Planctomycetota bacterium]
MAELPSSSIQGPGVDTLIEQVGDLLRGKFGFGLPSWTDGTNLVDHLAVIMSATSITGTQEPADDGDMPTEAAMSNPLRRNARRHSRRHGRPTQADIDANNRRILGRR